MRKSQSPLAHRDQPRTKVEFPAVNTAHIPIRWAVIIKEVIPIALIPVPAHDPLPWDWRYVDEPYLKSNDWGSITDATDDSENLDFGEI